MNDKQMSQGITTVDLAEKVLKHVLILVKRHFIPSEERLAKCFADSIDSGSDFDNAEYAIFNWAFNIENLHSESHLSVPSDIKEYISEHPKNALSEVIDINNKAIEMADYCEVYNIEFFMQCRRNSMPKQQACLDSLKEIESPANVKERCPHCGSNRIYTGDYEVDNEYNASIQYLRCRKCNSMWSNVLNRYDEKVCESSLEELFDMRVRIER